MTYRTQVTEAVLCVRMGMVMGMVMGMRMCMCMCIRVCALMTYNTVSE